MNIFTDPPKPLTGFATQSREMSGPLLHTGGRGPVVPCQHRSPSRSFESEYQHAIVHVVSS